MRNAVRSLAILLVALGAARCRAECRETADGVELVRSGKTIWAFSISNPEGKPFFHPLTLPDGRCITEIRPSDHIWHLGLWFCWKYINGVNCWEPIGNKGAESAGRMILREKRIETSGDSARIWLRLDWAERKTPEIALLREERTITVSAPDASGAYSITSAHHFVAGALPVKLDRTPPYQRGKGAAKTWAGGYAGLTCRLAPFAEKFAASSSSGETTQSGIIESERKWASLSDPASGHGIAIEVVKGTPQTRFYTWANRRFICPSAVYGEPLALKPGETLDLSFAIRIR